MKKRWVEASLGEIGRVSMCKRIFKDETTATGDIPFYKIGTFGKEPDAFIPNHIYKEYRAKYSFPKEGDVLISASGTIGRRVRYDGEAAYFQDSNIVWIDNDEKQVLNDYLYHFYGACEWNSTKGATISRLYNDNLRRIAIAFPESLAEQRRIVGILDEAFEGIATAKANAEKNLQNARALFESHLQSVFTQRGEGWVETTLGEAFDVRDGTHDSPKYHANGFPLITSKNLKREGLSFADVNLINAEDYAKINQRSRVHEGDVLFAMIGTIGNPTLVTVQPNFAIKNVALFKNPHGQSGAFLKHYLASAWVILKMMQEAKGTTQKFVGLGYLRSFPINVPPLATQLEVVESLDALATETQHLESIYQRKLAALDDLKKSLLHQAFSGEL